ncbi:MAG: hypothetical protein ACOY93_00965 [Bacillota bacterium]
MDTTLKTPEPESNPPDRWTWAGRLGKGLGMLLLMAAVSGMTAWGVFEWRIQSEQATAAGEMAALREQTLREVQDLRAELKQQQADLQAQMKQVQEAAQATGLLLQQEGEVTGLQARLAEIETLKLDLKATREQLETKLQNLEQSVRDQVAASGRETAEALSLEMRYKNLLVKAQGEVLLAQIYWAEGNRGLAKDELALGAGSLQRALTEAPEPAKAGIKRVVEQVEQTRAALILEQSSARDSLNLLWHMVNDLLAATGVE